jgi:DNA-binding phage protein
MKFFSKNKDTLSVISKTAKKRIALFVNGEFETDDLELIKKLKPHFKYEAKVVSGLARFTRLKKEAIEKGVYEKGMKKKDIEEILKEGE